MVCPREKDERMRIIPRRAVKLVLPLTALLVSACTPQLAETQRAAPVASKVADNSDPALWVVKDADTTIYLFGTVHLLKPGLSWFDEAVKDAFDKSDTLVTEIADMDNPAAMAPLVMKYAVDAKGRKLRDRLTASQRATYDAEMAKLKLPTAQLDAFDPWFVSLNASLVQYAKSRMNPESGSETILFATAKKAGKTQVALETAEQQFGWFDAVPETEQVDGLITALTKGEEAQAMIERMNVAWNKGNADTLATIMNEEMDKYPETRRLLLTDRNARWADWISKRLDTPGTVFMAVGAGHLAGQGSVQDHLARHKIRTTRVQY